MAENIYCPSCGSPINQYPNNHKCGDFYCSDCSEDYELKSKKDKFGSKIVDGEYGSMINKIKSATPSNFFFLAYKGNVVEDFFTIPKFFFTPEIIEKRKPLSPTGRRASWVGCNILYNQLPDSAKIFYVKNNEVLRRKSVLDGYKKVSFVADKGLESKGWLVDVMFCVENLVAKKGDVCFSLDEVYGCVGYLRARYPDNNNVEAKIRQQLQFLRDKGFVEFLSKRGSYRLVK